MHWSNVPNNVLFLLVQFEEESEKRRQAEWDALAVNIAKAMELKQRELDRKQR